jgi:hypothetical protein
VPNLNNRTVYRTAGGRWANKKNGNLRVTSLHDTQRAAEVAARTAIHKAGGGELITKGRDGKIRSKDTIAPGRESKRKDTEN